MHALCAHILESLKASVLNVMLQGWARRTGQRLGCLITQTSVYEYMRYLTEKEVCEHT